jgi:hypothetical protein
MIAMREIMNAEQTQVHPCNPQGWLRRLGSIAISPPGIRFATSCFPGNTLREKSVSDVSNPGRPVRRVSRAACNRPFVSFQTLRGSGSYIEWRPVIRRRLTLKEKK